MIARQSLRGSYAAKDGRLPSPNEARLQVVLFGPGEVWTRDVVRRVTTEPKAFALLIRLALCGSIDFVRRDALLALLWPEMDSTRGRNALSQAMHRLRRDLGSDVLVVRGHEEVALADHVWCDVRQFSQALQLAQLPEALALYRGPLLEAFHLTNAGAFDQWLDIQRHHTKEAAMRNALLLADREEAEGRQMEECNWLRRAVEISPEDDATLRRLIRRLARLGDTAGAIRAYESAAAKLWVELELEHARETRALVEALRKARSTPKPEVRSAFLRGRHMSSMLGQAERALASFRRAIALDPDYAPAHAGLAECLANLACLGHVPREQAAALDTAARRAIELDAEMSEPHVALGIGRLVFFRDWAGAENALRRAVELDPLSARAHCYLAFFLSNMGWFEEAVAEASRATTLDPIDPLASFLYGFTLYRARSYEVSLEHLRSLIELHPHHAIAAMFIAENELKLGRGAAAIRAARTAAALLPDDPLLLGICACILGFAGEENEAGVMLQNLRDSAEHRYINPHFLAAAHAGVGELDKAFSYWEAMIEHGEPGAFLLRTDPLFDPLRPDVRFKNLLERLQFPHVDSPWHAGSIDAYRGE